MKALAWLAVALSVAVSETAGQVQFRASASLVRLEVSVTDDRGHVRGLSASEFVLEDRGVRQAILVTEFNDTPLDVVLVAPPLSAMTFIAGDEVPRFTAGVTALLGQVEERDRLGIVLAASPPRRLRPLEAGSGAVGVEAFDVGKDNYSASFDAIALGLRMFDASDRRQALVAFTNAADFRSVISADTVAELASRLGPAFVLVGTPVTFRRSVTGRAELGVSGRPLGDPVVASVAGKLLPAMLQRLVDRSRGVVVNLGDDDPRPLMERMFASLRTGYVLAYELPRVKGWHPVTVKVNRPGVKVTVRAGYSVE